jgi:predicted esterase
MAVGKPAGAYFAMIPSVNKLWRQNSPGEISIVAAGEGSLEILARLNGNEKILKPVLLTLKSGLHRFKVRGTPAVLSSETVALEAEIRTSDGKVLASQKAELTAPGIVIDKFQSRIEELVASSPDPLFTRHLRSLQALVMAEWNRGLFLLDTSPNVVESAARDCQTILKGLDEDGGRWQTYVRGERALVVAKSTSPDSVLQFYLLKLPKNWDPKKTYPLIVDLHGAGPSNPLFYIMANMEPRQTVSTQSGPDPQQYFRLMPWGRGNSGYMEFGETDVMDSLDDVLRRFKTDPDRTFLTGHSMGGGGAWAFALHNPDRWAAVCPVSGATWRIPKGLGLADNVAYVPFRIWHGDADSSVPVESAYLMQAELRRAGNEPEMVILPGQGHDYPWVAQVSNTIWLMKHVRKRPDHFSFIAETDRWRGAWGITMTRSLGVSALPRFDCSINGNTVRIRSEGTTGLSVQLGQGGLGLSGPVTLWWNGQKVYEGQPQEVPLGDYVSRR